MERLLFGDNQFFGVNHMSEEKARAQAMKFRDTASIMRVLGTAYDEGIKTFMCTTHDRIGEVVDIVKAEPERYPDFTFYPGMPYAHKYANAVGELGIIGTLKKFAPGGILETVYRGAMAGVTQDLYALMRLLVDAEMKRFRGARTPVVFLQNVVTDLLLGFDMRDMFPAFADHVKNKYDAEVGFFSMNMPRLVDVLIDVGIENPIVCSNINKIGFRMCGGVDAYVECLRNKQFRPVAMSVFASGAIHPEDAIKWVCELPKLESIVFGASSAQNIRNTRDLVDKYWRFGGE